MSPKALGLITATVLMLSLGIAVIGSSDIALATQQTFAVVVGFVLLFILRGIDYRSLVPFIKFGYILSMILLIITLIMGFESRGSVRWIDLGVFNLQPSEIAKPVIILALAAFWSKRDPSWINILKSLGILLPIALLVFRQPDLGTTLTLVFIWLAILFAANISTFKMALMSITGAVMLPISWLFLHDYQRQRIISFMSPAEYSQGIGFHVIQSMIAVGSGQIFGRGLGRGTQSRLQFLPEYRTDFIFAFIAEELGFLGSSIIFILYIAIFLLLISIISETSDGLGELIVVGVLAMLFFQTVVNIGMNIGLLPITGITLPLLSYGGSSIVTTLVSLGLVLSIVRFGIRRRDIPEFSIFGR